MFYLSLNLRGTEISGSKISGRPEAVQLQPYSPYFLPPPGRRRGAVWLDRDGIACQWPSLAHLNVLVYPSDVTSANHTGNCFKPNST